MSSPSRGIIYIVTGQSFVDEACVSAASVKRCMPDIPITVFTDVAQSSSVFDEVVLIESPTHGPEDKILSIAKSPYRETLFLDSDTYMVDDSRELFSLLGRFDLAAAHAPYRAQYRAGDVPDCYPEFNTGVMLFRKSDQTGLLFERWGQIYREDRLRPPDWLFPGAASWYRHAIPNQPSFRRALYESALRVATLPPEYNCRLVFPGFVHTRVKIIHGRAGSLSRTSAALNKTMLPRVHIMRWGRLKILESAMPPGEDFLARTRWSLHHRGIAHTARTTVARLVARVGKVFKR